MTLETWKFIITIAAFIVAAVVALYTARRMPALSWAVVVWFALAWLLSSNGFFKDAAGWSDGDIVGFFIFGTLISLPIVIIAIGWIRSADFRDFLTAIPLPLLIGIEAYRIAGAIFWWMYLQDLLPPEMGLVTGFADVFIGTTALPLAWAVARDLPGSHQSAIVWNLFGLSDFAIAVSMVLLSILGVVTFQPDPVQIGLHPLALISLFQMPLSIIIHLLALYKLVIKRDMRWKAS
jgi:hypothetical protein